MASFIFQTFKPFERKTEPTEEKTNDDNITNTINKRPI